MIGGQLKLLPAAAGFVSLSIDLEQQENASSQDQAATQEKPNDSKQKETSSDQKQLEKSSEDSSTKLNDPLEAELLVDDDLPFDELPIGDLPIGDSADTGETASESDESDFIDLPLFGRTKVSELGMPLFTVAVGLVDGFNPCAMWVLLFLLSILVNLKDRTRIVLVAGTFVVISGVAYFLFMAAWLQVFMMVGLLRPIQIALALLAIAVGSIHIKDFFAFKKGISLSIPESAKPGIYRRVRSIINAEHLWGALVAAAILAVLVNIVELLCTAGLPAIYTEILTLRQYSLAVNYAYLGLYILAYMFDDALMVFVVTYTMSKTKLQETQGRWLKLVSGLVIVLLGMVMLLFPSWLF